jgi:ubiquinone biosynthesis protein UbiJ
MADKKVLSLKQSLIPPEIRAAWANMDEEARFAWYYNELVQLKVQIKELEARITRMEEGD